jgi:hypothetical protein
LYGDVPPCNGKASQGLTRHGLDPLATANQIERDPTDQIDSLARSLLGYRRRLVPLAVGRKPFGEAQPR